MNSPFSQVYTSDDVVGVELRVAMPITERIYRVLFEGLGPAQAMAELIGGSKSPHS
jgi:glycerol-3-phosphate dehydrogenase